MGDGATRKRGSVAQWFTFLHLEISQDDETESNDHAANY